MFVKLPAMYTLLLSTQVVFVLNLKVKDFLVTLKKDIVWTFKAEKKSRSREISIHLASGGIEEAWVSGGELGVQVVEDSS